MPQKYWEIPQKYWEIPQKYLSPKKRKRLKNFRKRLKKSGNPLKNWVLSDFRFFTEIMETTQKNLLLRGCIFILSRFLKF